MLPDPLLQEFTATSTQTNDSLATIVKAAYKTKGYSFSSSILPDGKVTFAYLLCCACVHNVSSKLELMHAVSH